MSVFISKEIPSLSGTCFWFVLWMYVDKQVVVIVAFITNFGFCTKLDEILCEIQEEKWKQK